jgi:hypothetical protein
MRRPFVLSVVFNSGHCGQGPVGESVDGELAGAVERPPWGDTNVSDAIYWAVVRSSLRFHGVGNTLESLPKAHRHCCRVVGRGDVLLTGGW